MNIKIVSFYKNNIGYVLKLILITNKYIYREKFWGDYSYLSTIKHLIQKTDNTKAKFKFYNSLKKHCSTFESIKEKRKNK